MLRRTPVMREEARFGRMMALAKALQAERANPYGKRIVRISHWPFQAGKGSMELSCHQVTGHIGGSALSIASTLGVQKRQQLDWPW